MFKYFDKYILKSVIKVMLRIFWVFPVKNDVVMFINEHSHSFSDNLKYVALYMERHIINKKYNMIFALSDCTEIQDRKIIPVKIFSLKFFYYALTSAVLVVNAGGISYLPLRKKQIVINTWHGGGPYKKTGIDSIDSIWYKKQTKRNAEMVTYLLSSCRICTEEEAKSLYYSDQQCINSGTPRIDMLFSDCSLIREKIYKCFHLPMNKKIILYAPTYRGIFENYKGVLKDNILELEYKKIVEAAKRKFGGDWVFAVRLHPRLRNIKFSGEDIINMNDYPDVQEILASVDMLITDYSSIMWDYSFTGNPCFIFATDIDEYILNRGFYMEPSKWPFPIARNNSELINNICLYDERLYHINIKKHHFESGSYENGCACKVASDIIIRHFGAAN